MSGRDGGDKLPRAPLTVDRDAAGAKAPPSAPSRRQILPFEGSGARAPLFANLDSRYRRRRSPPSPPASQAAAKRSRLSLSTEQIEVVNRAPQGGEPRPTPPRPEKRQEAAPAAPTPRPAPPAPPHNMWGPPPAYPGFGWVQVPLPQGPGAPPPPPPQFQAGHPPYYYQYPWGPPPTPPPAAATPPPTAPAAAPPQVTPPSAHSAPAFPGSLPQQGARTMPPPLLPHPGWGYSAPPPPQPPPPPQAYGSPPAQAYGSPPPYAHYYPPGPPAGYQPPYGAAYPAPPQPPPPPAQAPSPARVAVRTPFSSIRPAAAPPAAAQPPLDEARRRAIAINRRITSAGTAKEILDTVQYELEAFDAVALATAAHRLASLRGGGGGAAEAVARSPEFHKLLGALRRRASELSGRHLANVVWALAKMGHRPEDPAVLEALCAQIPGKVAPGADNCNAQNVSNLLWGLGALGHRPQDVALTALAQAVSARAGELTSQHVANCVLAFARLEVPVDPGALGALGAAAAAQLPSFTSQALSNTLYGLAKLGATDGELFRAMGPAAAAGLPAFGAQNLANTMYAYGLAGVHPGDAFMREFSGVAIHKVQEFTPQHLANVAWALARLGAHDTPLFSAMAWRAAQTMHSFTPQAISNFIWAYATLGQPPDAAFLSAAVAHAAPTLATWAPQHIANVAWAMGVLRDEEVVRAAMPTLLTALAREVHRRLTDPAAPAATEFSRQHLVNYLSGLAAARYNPGPTALRALAAALRPRVAAGECLPQELAAAAAAAAKLGFYDPALLEAIAEEAVVRMDEFTGAQIATLACAGAKLGFHHADLMKGAAAALRDHVGPELSDKHLAYVAYAYALLNVAAPELFAEVKPELLRRLGGGGGGGAGGETQEGQPVKGITRLLWACAVANVLDRPLWDAFQWRLAAAPPPRGKKLLPVAQAAMLARARHPEQDWPMDAALASAAAAAWREAAADYTVSALQREVSLTLAAMGEPHEVEHMTEDKAFSIDIAFPAEKVALEVDGPHHFARNTLRPLATLFSRALLLETRGWRVASVPFFAWEGAEEEARRALLRGLLDKARAGGQQGPAQDAAAPEPNST